jgi:hypothetical protein
MCVVTAVHPPYHPKPIISEDMVEGQENLWPPSKWCIRQVLGIIEASPEEVLRWPYRCDR